MMNNKADLNLGDVLNVVKRDIMINLNCHAIGEVQSFDASKCTCTVKIAYSKKFKWVDDTGKKQTRLEEYPLLVNCPTVIFSGVMIPIKQGDSCLVLFNDRAIDNWVAGAKSGEVGASRFHSISDGLVIVGLRAAPTAIPNYDPVNPTLYNGETKVRVKSDKILIENASDKLGALLKELITEIKNMQIQGFSGPSPAMLPVAPASVAAISAVATKIEGLLE